MHNDNKDRDILWMTAWIVGVLINIAWISLLIYTVHHFVVKYW